MTAASMLKQQIKYTSCGRLLGFSSRSARVRSRSFATYFIPKDADALRGFKP